MSQPEPQNARFEGRAGRTLADSEAWFEEARLRLPSADVTDPRTGCCIERRTQLRPQCEDHAGGGPGRRALDEPSMNPPTTV